MKKLLLGGIALGAGPRLFRRRQCPDQDRRRRPAHRPERGLRCTAEERRRAGGRRHQRGRRRARPEDRRSFSATTSPIRSRASRSPTSSSATASSRRRPLQLRRHHAGLGSLRRERHARDHPGPTNPKITERGLWNTFRTCGRDDQQGGVAAAYIAQELQGQEDRRRPRQDHLRPGPRRRDQEGAQRRRAQGSPV